LRVVGKTDVGLVRKTNQDDFACGIYEDGNAWAVVCDGMGGVNGGSVASTKAVGVISERLKSGYDGNTDMAAVKKLLIEALTLGNSEVFQTALNDPALFGMGTTVVACITTGQNAYIAHAGDSRAYLVGANGAIPLTRDHSIVQEMLESGKLNPEEAQIHPQRNIITRALGVDETLDIDFCETTFADGTALLICTDGLTNVVDTQAIARITSDKNNNDSVAALIDLANANGGNDNITVVIINK
jgi:serine/threonine protein phosphatase PrpC